MNFREDIEGLRGLSIIFVILFHYYSSFFINGVYGVDILFVISGFVITNSIYRKNFTCLRFYQRRINRIYPAAYLCLCWIIFDNIHFYKSLSLLKDIQAASVYLANIRFYKSSVNYFNSDYVSPILHFWSLSIENQFYLFYPLLFIFFHNIFNYVVVTIAVVSFFLLCANYKINTEYTYFLIDTRIWELLLGSSSFSIYNSYKISTNILSNIEYMYLILVIVVIFFKYFVVPGPFTLFPTVFAGLVCLNDSETKNIILTNFIIRFLGRISYSLYLIHYPLVSLSINIYMKIIISLAFSTLSFYLIEKIFLNINISKRINFLVLFLLIGVINIYIYMEINKLKISFLYTKEMSNNCDFIILRGKCFLSYNSVKYILWGDSHLEHYGNVIKSFISNPAIIFLSYFWHLMNNEEKIIESILNQFKNVEIIFSGFLIDIKLYNISHTDAEIVLNKNLILFTRHSKKVVFIQDNPFLHFDPFQAQQKGLYTFEIGKNASLYTFNVHSSVITLNPFLLLCPNNHICNLTFYSQQIYRDDNHLNRNLVYIFKDYFSKEIKIKKICNKSTLYWCELREYRFMNQEERKYIKFSNISVLDHLHPTPVKFIN